MKWNVVISAVVPVILLSCTGKRGQGEQAPTDSARVADTSHQVASPVRSVSYEERQGAALYGKYCSVCHGTEGKGDGFNAFNLDPRPRDFSDSTFMKALSDDQLVQTISGGGKSVNKSPLMPSYRGTLSRQQISYIVRFIRSRSSGG
jgi:cytochrome c oxidase cbb3-type subunit III